MAKRRTVLGIPIGRKRRPSVAPQLIALAGAGVAAPAAVAIAKRAAGAAGKGRQAVGQALDVAGKVSHFTEEVGRHKSTLGKAGAAIKEFSNLGKEEGPPKLSHLIEEHIDVGVARSTAYNQWTQFETFPSIFKGAERVEQGERDQLEWTSKIGGSRRSWHAEITEQVPDERISWRSSGLQLKGVVTFHSLAEDLTTILVEIEYTPTGPVEHVGRLLRIQRRRVRRDLRLFKHFVELRGEETGAWRSRIAKKDDDSSRSSSSAPHSNHSSSNGKSRSKPPARQSSGATRTAKRPATSGRTKSGARTSKAVSKR